jgi:hypothetical protein
MKVIPALMLVGLLTGSADAAPAGPGIDLVNGDSDTSLELIFQAGNGSVAGFDLWLTFSSRHAAVTPTCEQFLSDAIVVCEIVKKNAVRIFVAAPFMESIPVVASQHLATIDFEFLGHRAVFFIVAREHYFDADGNVIKARKGKKKWKSRRP